MSRIANNAEEAAKYVEDEVAAHKVVIFSKSTCPFCIKVKGLFEELKAEAHAVELDQLDPEDEVLVRAALKDKTSQTSTPNVFISQKHIGGCDDTFKVHAAGELAALLE